MLAQITIWIEFQFYRDTVWENWGPVRATEQSLLSMRLGARVALTHALRYPSARLALVHAMPYDIYIRCVRNMVIINEMCNREQQHKCLHFETSRISHNHKKRNFGKKRTVFRLLPTGEIRNWRFTRKPINMQKWILWQTLFHGNCSLLKQRELHIIRTCILVLSGLVTLM